MRRCDLRGRIDVLVNDAGGVLGQVGRPLEDVPEADWRAIVAVNLDGVFYCSQAVAPAMKAARHGRIVNISSGAGLGVSLTGIQAYASAKAGQIGLTRQLAHELGPWGITVNNIAPGFVRSNPTTEKQWESYGEDGAAAARGEHRTEAPGLARRHRERRGVFRQRVCRLDHRPDALDRRRQVAGPPAQAAASLVAALQKRNS